MSKTNCLACRKNVAKSAKALKCAYCTRWYHIGCLSLDDGDFEFMAQRKQGFRWFCGECDETINSMLAEGRCSSDFEKKVIENVSAVVTNTLEKFQAEISGKMKALEEMVSSGSSSQGPVPQPEAFVDILKEALDKSKHDNDQCKEVPITINSFGRSEIVEDQQVLIVKVKPGKEANAATAVDNIKSALKSVPVNSIRETRTGSLVVKFPSESAKREAGVLVNSCFDSDSDFVVSEPKKAFPKMTVVGISASLPDDEIIDNIIMKNKEVSMLVQKGCLLSMIFAKIKGNYKYAVIKIAPEIRTAIEKMGSYLYVGLSRCKVYDRFWVTQCFHCQKFGHTSSNCSKKNENPVCAFCAGAHE